MTRKRKRDPGSGVTPLLGEQLVYAETGMPVPHESEPPRRRRTKLAAQPPPPRADVQALHDDLFGSGAGNRDEIERTFAGIRVRELRRERDQLDAELAEVEDLVRLHRSTLPGTLIPTSLYAKFDRIADGIRANERALAQCRHALAPGVPEIVVLTPRQERERRVARAKSAAVLERARTEGRKEAYVASGVIDKLLAHPTPSAVSGLVTASSGPAPLGGTPTGSVLSQARADVDHPLHGDSQRVVFQGRPAMVFTGR